MAFSEDKKPKKVIINKALDWTGMNLSEQVKTVRFIRDEDNNAYGIFAVLIDPTYTTDNILARERVVVRDAVGDVNQSVQPSSIAASQTEILSTNVAGWATTWALQGLYNNLTVAIEKQRTPTHFWSITDKTGDFTIVSPGAGVRFRLLGYSITIAGPALAAAAKNSIYLLDGATDFIHHDFYCPLAAASLSTIVINVNLPGNGYLSTAVNQDLGTNLVSNLTAGSYSVNAWGTLEA
jgi:hypothetical protein